MTDNEIIKAIELCSTDALVHCEDCPFYYKCLNDENLFKYAIDLINRQKAEIEQYKDYTEKWMEKAEELKAEVERYEIEMQMVYGYADALEQRAKAEAVKEFAERLKTEYAKGMSWFKKKESYYVDVEDIDNLLKEMGGENDG